MRWQLIRRLGSGGSGDVFLATDGRTTAVVKVLRDYWNETARRFFVREIRILRARLHANIVPFIDGDEAAERPYYVMPYFAQGSLTKHAGRLTREQLRAAVSALCDAVAAMHERSVAHGDIKPDNILITNEGAIRVGDPLGHGQGCTVTLNTTCGGTPGYRAPEVLRGGSISPAGDMYSIGATLFHLATGRVPYDDQNMDPQQYGVSVADDIRALILAACHSDAARRPSAKAILHYLKNGQWPAKPRRAAPFIAGGLLGAFAVVLLAVLAKK